MNSPTDVTGRAFSFPEPPVKMTEENLPVIGSQYRKGNYFMSKSESNNENPVFNSNEDTVFMFPERCSMGVIESMLSGSTLPVRFSTLDLELDEDDDHEFLDLFHLIRKSSAVRVTHLPNPVSHHNEESGSSLVVSFHKEYDTSQNWDSPLVAAVVSMNQENVMSDLERFNEHIVRLESLGLAIAFGMDMSILMLLELQAIGESFFESHPFRLGNFLFTPTYYAEFQPRLSESLEPLLHALSHQRASKPVVHGEESIDMTGLLPEGLA